MAKIIYQITEHDGGWAYQVAGSFSETFASRAAARRAAERAAREQRVPGHEAAIAYEDAHGRWHEELAEGGDRPETKVNG